jgi:hypothetical protein
MFETRRSPTKRGGHANCNTDRDQYQDLAQHHPEHLGAPGPKRDADADFVSPFRGDVGHYAIDPDAGEKNCEQSEESGELGDKTLVND